MKVFFLLIISIFSLALSVSEDDKILSCDLITEKRLKLQKDTIDKTLTQEGFLKKGIERLISLDILMKCLKDIPDDKVKEIIEDGKFLIEDVDLDKFNYGKIDLEPYGKMNEFFFDDEHREVMKKLNVLKYSRKNRKPRRESKSESGGDL